MLLLGFGAGLGSIASLGQLLSGPAVSVQRVARPPGARAPSDLSLAALRASAGATAAPAAAVTVSAASPSGVNRRPAAAPSTPAHFPTHPQPRPVPVARRAGSRPSGAPPAGRSSPSVADQLAASGKSLTSTLPSPAGPAVAQALGTVATTVDQLLPGHGSAPAAPAPATHAGAPPASGASPAVTGVRAAPAGSTLSQLP